MIKMLKILSILLLSFTMVFNVSAKEKRVFSEDEFINVFSGKPKSRVLKYLGEPDKKILLLNQKGQVLSWVAELRLIKARGIRPKLKCGTTTILWNMHLKKLISS